MTVYAVAESVPGQRSGYLTAGKKYEVVDLFGDHAFAVIDDEGDRMFADWEGCYYLDGGNWTRIDEPTPSQTVSQDRAVEAVARALCTDAGIDPDAADPRDVQEQAKIKLLGTDHFVPLLPWHNFTAEARAAIAAFKKSEVGHE